jgi:hypothetical protein
VHWKREEDVYRLSNRGAGKDHTVKGPLI